MSVALTDASSTPIPEALRVAYQRVVENALDLMRPAGEQWSVTMDASEAALRLDFARNTDAPRSLTVAVDGDNQHHSQLFRSVCTFLWMYWAKDVAERS
jgi:hypothetical protein